MNQDTWSHVDDYYKSLFVHETETLKAARKNSQKHGLPDIAVSPNQGQFLATIIKISNTKRVLEIGTLGAYSTLCMAECLPEDGKIITLEYDRSYAEVALENIEFAGKQNMIELIEGPALESMNTLIMNDTKPFDLIFIDADKSNNPGYLDRSLKLARRGTLIIADNVVREGKISDANSNDEKVQAIREFNQKIHDHSNLKASVLQTVGEKGYDGMSFIIVEGIE